MSAVNSSSRLCALAVAALAAFSVLSAAPASAAARTCAKTGSVAAGTVVTSTQDWTWTDADGNTLDEAALVEVTKPAGKTLARGKLFKAESDVTLRFGGQTFKLTGGSYFNLQCWGESPKIGAIHPSVGLFDGSVTATGPRVGITTAEGLFNPHGPIRQTIKASRDAAKGLADNFLTGKTSARKTAGGGWLGITPYVGKGPGVCRYGKGAKGKTTSFKRGTRKGTMTFSGLASFSPR